MRALNATSRRRSARRWMAGAVVAVAGAIVPSAMAFACVGITSLNTSSSTVAPGGTLNVTGKDFAVQTPVILHLDTLNGSVLATIHVNGTGAMTSTFSQVVTIPSDVPVGAHLLVATQDEHNMNGGTPARAAIYVGNGPVPAPAGSAARPAGVIAGSGLGVGVLALIGLAAAAASLLVAGAISASSRRRARPQPVKPS